MDECLFTAGPVQMYPETLEVAGRPVPYFRNASFSQVMLRCEELFCKALGCDDAYRLITLTASGTGAMEASVMNCLDAHDRAIVVDGGTFGHRFAAILEWHGIPHDVVDVPFESDLTRDMLDAALKPNTTAFLVNLDETSIGKLYDLDLIAAFCRENGLFLIVDAVSAFLSDEIDMPAAGIDVLLTGSQKGLSLSPGLSFVVLGPAAQERLEGIKCPSMYFDFKDYLLNGVRGQTPFTPAIGIIYELLDMLERIDAKGGAAAMIGQTREVALDFRARLADSKLPVELPPFTLSNALTPIVLPQGGAVECNRRLVEEHGLVVNPCGGANADRMLRIAHIGCHTKEGSARLIKALEEVLSE